MSRNDLNMENLFRDQMDSFSVDPSPGLWQKVHVKIIWKQFLTFSFQSFNVYYLAAVLSLAGAGTYIWLSRPPAQEQTARSRMEIEAESPIQPSPEDALSQEQANPADAEMSESLPGILDGDRDKDPASREKKQIRKSPILQSPEKKPEKSDESATAPGYEDKDGKKSDVPMVKVDFTANLVSGCSPLAVQFENLSENAGKYNWTFGDGGSSAERNPSYVFDESGEFPVNLKVLGEDGLEYSTQQTILVFETPKALFEMDEAVDLSKNQPVYFYNYSRGAEYYEWDFGDQQRSNLAEPIHNYQQEGSYDVKLKVWTDNQCYDSLVILNAFTGPEGEIQFPNAFTPNLTGPAGGYYEPNDISNDVFHPVVSGELIEYQLKIFNRQGLQIFESNDAAIGWDGYYQEKLAAQAVYIWKARGKFSNGKTFVKSGDVTLIHLY